MRFRENRILACFVALVVVLITILASGGGRLGAQRAAAEELFYHGKNGSGQCIQSDINARLDAACNLITVAGRYMQSGDEKVAALEAATQALQSAQGISALYEANQALDEPTEALYQALNALSLSDRDESLVQKQYVNFTSRADSIRRDSYNESARQYNQERAGMPASLIASLTGNEPLQLFD